MGETLALGRSYDRIERVDAGVNDLRSQRAFEAPANNQQHGAMHQGPQGKHQAVVVGWISSQHLGQALAEEIERGPRLVQGRGLADAVEQHLVGVGMIQGKLDLSAAGFLQGAGAAQGGEEFVAGLSGLFCAAPGNTTDFFL